MKKYLAGAVILFALFFTQTLDVFASCGANLTIDLQKQSRDYFTEGQVTVLQNFLKDRGFLQSDVTGFFGDDTFSAVKRYQIASGISPASGFVGPLTRFAINSELCTIREVSTIDQIIGGAELTDNNQPAVLGVSISDSYIAAAPRSTVVVSLPRGGEEFDPGEKLTIKVKAEKYYSDDVVSLYVVPVKGSTGEPYTLTENLKGSSFKWKIPKNIIGGKYVIRAHILSCYDGAADCRLDGDDSEVIYINNEEGPGETDIFTTDLTIGSSGFQVTKLQEMLISQGYLVMSPGSTTGFFGVQTKAALAKWQVANSISPADGYFGPTSRAKANQVVCYKDSCGVTPPIKLSVPVAGASYNSTDEIKLEWSAFNGDFDHYRIYLGVGTLETGDIASDTFVSVVKKTRTSYAFQAQEVSNFIKKISDRDYKKNLRFIVAAIKTRGGYGVGETIVSEGRGNNFEIISNASTVKASINKAEIIGAKPSYNFSNTEAFSFDVKAQDTSLSYASPKLGFNVQAYVEEKNAKGEWIDTPSVQGVNGTYDYSNKIWRVTSLIPTDTNKQYRARAITYCSAPRLGCLSDYDNQEKYTQTFEFKVTSDSAVTPVVSSLNLNGLGDNYTVGAPIIYKVEGVLSKLIVGKPDVATPSQGYAARAAIEEYDSVGNQWFTRSGLVNTASMSSVGVWDSMESVWQISMKAPLDASKKYRIRTVVHCANQSLGCKSGAGTFALDTKSIVVSAGAPVTPTPALTCSITTDKSSYNVGDMITYSWKSKNATYAFWKQEPAGGRDHLVLPGDKLSANGSQQVKASVQGNPSVTLMLGGLNDASGSCTKAVKVVAATDSTGPSVISEADAINNIKNDARKIKSALASYYADNGAYPPAEMPLSTLVSSNYLGKYLSTTPKFSVEGITSFPVDASTAVYYYARSEQGLQCGKGGLNTSFVAESKDLPYILLFTAKPDSAEKSYYEPAKYFNRAWFSKRDTHPAHWSYCL